MYWPFRRKPRSLNSSYREAEVYCLINSYDEIPSVVHVMLCRSGGVVRVSWQLISIEGKPPKDTTVQKFTINESGLETDDLLTESLENVLWGIRRCSHHRSGRPVFAHVGRWKWLPISYQLETPCEPPNTPPDPDNPPGVSQLPSRIN
jgi:hypothetical protein